MHSFVRGTTAALAAAALLASGAAAQDTSDEIIFDNSVPSAGDIAENADATATLFAGWQIAYQLYRDAVAADASDVELEVLAAASEAAGAAYEASLVARNTVTLAAAGMEPMTDEMIAQITMATE